MQNTKKLKKFLYTIIFFSLTVCMIVNSRLSLFYAALGLELWFDKMVPALFPFMILSGIMIRLGLTENFTAMIYPLIKPLFRVSKNVCYCMIIGFLCGFPMGAKTIADMYSVKKISRPEAEYLLCFVNNIGPVYFVGYVLPLLNRTLILPYVAGMYLIPFLYGLFLRYTKYLSVFEKSSPKIKVLKAASFENDSSLFHEIDASIQSAVSSILILGGYMIFFNILNLIPHMIYHKIPILTAPLMEISGGLSLLSDTFPLYTLLLLPFGGLCCIAQTYTCIRNTDLKISNYCIHKIILTLLTCVYYFLWKVLSPDTFLI